MSYLTRRNKIMYRFLESPIGQVELLEIKKLQENGRITNLHNILNMSVGDIALFKRLLWLAEYHNQSDNLIMIGKRGHIYDRTIYISVRDLKSFKPIIDDFKFNMRYENINFVENVKSLEFMQYTEWTMHFCAPDQIEDKDVCKASIKGIKIGALTIDDISFEATSEDIVKSIEAAINELIKSHQESINESVSIIEQASDEQSVTVEEEPKSKKETRGIISEDELTCLINKSFEGCEMVTSSINYNNVTQPVLDILPEIKPFIISYSRNIYNIVITNTGVVFLSGDKECYTLYIKDGKRETRLINEHFFDMMISDTNRNGIAMSIGLYRI